MSFLSEDFLLTTASARELYHKFAEDQPIIDYHCHVSPKEIWEDKRFSDITEIWLGGDRLFSLNEKYAPILLKNFENVACCGKVVGKLKRK